MWNFIESYFRERHGRDINASEDSASTIDASTDGWIAFASTRQQHFVRGQHSHDTTERVVVHLSHVGNGYVAVRTSECPGGVEVEHTNSEGLSHVFVSDDLLWTLIVVAHRPVFESADEIAECRLVENRTSNFVCYSKA